MLGRLSRVVLALGTLLVHHSASAVVFEFDLASLCRDLLSTVQQSRCWPLSLGKDLALCS